MASLLNMSGGSLLGKSLPYDAEIEYLESTGTQYIDTDVYPDLLVDFSMEFKLLPTDASTNPIGIASKYNIGYGNDKQYSLSRTANKNWYYSFVVIESSDGQARTTAVDDTVAINLPAVIKIDGKDLYVDGAYIGTNDFRDSTSFNFTTIWLYGWHRVGVAPSTIVPVTFYYFKAYKSNVLVRDMIPVRVGQTGYMYDKVSGQLFGNSGTGDFILGNDI